MHVYIYRERDPHIPQRVPYTNSSQVAPEADISIVNAMVIWMLALA